MFKFPFVLGACVTVFSLSGCAQGTEILNTIGDNISSTIEKPASESTNNSSYVDWTPYLKPMLNGCDYVNPDDIPEELKPSIVDFESKMDGVKTYTLKNAKAFNQPLKEVEIVELHEAGETKLTFMNSNFKSLRPYFKMPKLAEDVGFISNDESGYRVETPIGEKGLEFDIKNNTIKCYY